MMQKTQDNRTIHRSGCKEMLTQRAKLQKHRSRRIQPILEHATRKQGETKDRQNKPYVKEAEKTEITQYIAKHPEMPENGAKPKRQEADSRNNDRISNKQNQPRTNKTRKREARTGDTHVYTAGNASARP